VKRGRRSGQEKEVSEWRLALAVEHNKHGLNRKEIEERKTQQRISRRTKTEVFDRMPQREVGLYGRKKKLRKERILSGVSLEGSDTMLENKEKTEKYRETE
jgi:hypothetical protein